MTAQGYESNDKLPTQVKRELTDEEQSVYRIAYNNSLAAGHTVKKADEDATEAVHQMRGM